MTSGSFNEKIEGILEPHQHIVYIIQQRKIDRRDYLRMIPGLLPVGHETTTDLLSTATVHLLKQDL